MIYRLILLLALWCSTAHALVFGPIMASSTTYAPSAPVSVSGAAGNGQVVVSWSAGTVDGTHSAATSFNLWRGTSSGGTSLWQSGVTSPYTDTASNGTGYYYKVEAVNSAGSTLSAEAGPYTPAATVYAPNIPVIGTATAGNAQASVAFTASVVDGTHSAATSYTATSSPGGFTATGSVSPLTVTGLTNGTAYTFTVTATNSAGTSGSSSASNSVTPSTGGVYTFDGTAGTAPDSSFFTVFAAGSGAANLDGSGNLYIRNPSASTDGALVYRTNAIDYNTTKTYKVKVKTSTSLIAAAAGGAALQIIHAPSKAAPLGAGNDASIEVIDWVVTNDSGVKAFVRYVDSSGGAHELSGGAWTAAGVGVSSYPVSMVNDTYYWFYFYTTATGWSVGAKAADDTTVLLAKTAEITWANTKALAGGESFWLRMGDKYSYAWQFGEYIDTYSEQ